MSSKLFVCFLYPRHQSYIIAQLICRLCFECLIAELLQIHHNPRTSDYVVQQYVVQILYEYGCLTVKYLAYSYARGYRTSWS